MRPTWLVLAFLACSGGSTATRGRWGDPALEAGAFGEEDRYVPPYAKSDVSRTLQTERGLEASQERVVAELEASPERDDEQWRTASADLGVRRRFIASLEACEATGRRCPPRLDDPPWPVDPEGLKIPVTADLRFDLDSWRRLADELHGRACACRTLFCVDTVGVAIDQLEPRPMPEVQGDEAASASLTRARECLFRLRGKQHRYRAPRTDVP